MKELIATGANVLYAIYDAKTATTTSYPIWTVTLHPVEGGTASSHDIPEDQFPDLGPRS